MKSRSRLRFVRNLRFLCLASSLLFCSAGYAQDAAGPLDPKVVQGEIESLEREARWYSHQAEEMRKSAQGWQEDAQTLRKTALQHNDKTGLEAAAYYEGRAKEIQTEADRLQKIADEKIQEAQKLKSRLPVVSLTGFWQDEAHHQVIIVQAGSQIAMDLRNGIVMTGNLTARELSVKYQWTAEQVARHIQSETEKGPQGAADRVAALKALAGKVATLSGTVSQDGQAIRGYYDETFEADAETKSSAAGTTVRTEQPVKAPITLLRDRSKPRCISETFAQTPANFARTKIGVGETVQVRLLPAQSDASAAAEWTKSGNGHLSSNSGLDITFTAGERAGTTVLTARSPSGNTCSIRFTVVEPDNVFLELLPGSEFHRKGEPSAGFLGRWYITPSDVSFSNLQIRELEALASTVGVLEGGENKPHRANPVFTSMDSTVEGRGTPGERGHFDQVVYWVHGTTAEDGTASNRIPYEYRVGDDGTPKTFAVLAQMGILKNGVLTVSKGGVKVSMKNEDESTPSWTRFGADDPR